MRSIILVFFMLICQSVYSATIPTQIHSVYDGDTFKVSIAQWPAIVGDRINVRVAGVDTPELRGHCDREKQLARKAKAHTVAFLRSGGNVELHNVQRGKYFRIVADVYVNGESLSESLIMAGLGYSYKGGKKRSWC